VLPEAARLMEDVRDVGGQPGHLAVALDGVQPDQAGEGVSDGAQGSGRANVRTIFNGVFSDAGCSGPCSGEV
jgi:hypothetical protein